MPMIRFALAILLVSTVAAGCMSAADHQRSLGSAEEREMTVGVVQKEIHAGMTQEEVAAALGSPNIVTRGIDGRESWIYDKISSEASYSNSDVYGTILILGGSRAAGASGTTQKTLTVLIKFGHDQLVDTYSYHASKF